MGFWKNRRPPVRRRVPLAERVASVVVLMLLAGVALAIAVLGARGDAGRFTVDPALMAAATSSAPDLSMHLPQWLPAVAAAPTAPAPAEPPAADDPYADHETAAPADQLDLAAGGLAPIGPREHYDADTLYEKINGQAGTYMAQGFESLRCRSYGVPGGGPLLEVFLYDMGTPQGAQGMMALERDPAGEPLDFARGYRSGGAHFIVADRYYAQLLPTEDSEQARTAADLLARELAGRLPADDQAEAGPPLPTAGQLPNTIQYFPTDAHGLDFMKDVHEADYLRGKATLRFFMMKPADEAAARDAYDRYLEFCRQFGTVAAERKLAGARLFEADNFGFWKIVYQRGAEVGGVNDAEDRAAAVAMVEEYLGGQ